MGTISPLVREHVTRKRPLSRTGVRHQPVPSSCGGHPPHPSSSLAAAVLGCATHCVVMIPTQWDGPRAGHLNYFKTVTVDRLETQGQPKDQNLDVYAFLPHSTQTRTPLVPIFLICPFKRPLNLSCWWPWLPRDFPGRSILHSSRISPSPARRAAQTSIFMLAHIHPKLTKATHSSFEIALSLYTNTSLNAMRCKDDVI